MDKGQMKLSREIPLNGNQQRVKPESVWNEVNSSRIAFYSEKLTFIKRHVRFEYIWFLLASVIEYSTHNISSLEAWLTVLFTLSLGILSQMQNFVSETAFNENYSLLDNEKTEVWTGSKFEELNSSDLIEGDIVKLKPNSKIPADILMLARFNISENVMVDMSDLLGCPSVVEKVAIEKVESMVKAEITEWHLENLIGRVKACDPSGNYNEFFGTLKLKSHPSAIKVTNENLLYGGSVLKSYSFVVGVVVYAERERRLFLNMKKVIFKGSRIEAWCRKVIQGSIVFNSLVFFAILLVGVFYNERVLETGLTENLLLSSNCIPGLTMLGVLLLKKIKPLLNSKLEKGNIVKMGPFSENLGQLEYILTDKSGVLTLNQHEVEYFFLEKNSFTKVLSKGAEEKGFLEFNNLSNLLKDPKDMNLTHHFIRSVCLCNKVVLTDQELFGSQVELACLQVAKLAGYTIEILKPKRFNIYHDDSMKAYKKIASYSAEGVFYVFIQDYSKKKGYIYTKGEGLIMKPHFDKETQSKIQGYLNILKEENCKSIVYGYREMEKRESKEFKSKFMHLENSFVNSERKIKLLFEKMAENQEFLSVIGVVETKNNEGKKFVSQMKELGVKVWLTSSDTLNNTLPVAKESGIIEDKVAEILEISTELLFMSKVSNLIKEKFFAQNSQGSNFMKLLQNITIGASISSSETSGQGKLFSLFGARNTSQNTESMIRQVESLLKQRLNSKIENYSVVIDRQSFLIGLKNEHCRRLLVALLICSKSVCFVGLQPLEKGFVVELIREFFRSKSCVGAIGAGFGDINMLQSADIGILVNKSTLATERSSDIVVKNLSSVPKLALDAFIDCSFYYQLFFVLIFKNTVHSVIVALIYTFEVPKGEIEKSHFSLELSFFTFFIILASLADYYFDKKKAIKPKKYSEGVVNSISLGKISIELLVKAVINAFSGFMVISFMAPIDESEEILNILINSLVFSYIIRNRIWSLYISSISIVIALLSQIPNNAKIIPNPSLVYLIVLTVITAYLFEALFKSLFYLYSKKQKTNPDPKLDLYSDVKSLYNPSFSKAFAQNTSEKLLNNYSLEFISEYAEEKYKTKFIKENLPQLKNNLGLLIFIISVVIIVCFYLIPWDLSLKFFILSLITWALITSIYFYVYYFQASYKFLIIFVTILGILAKFIASLISDIPMELASIIIPSCTLLVPSALWMEMCEVNIINIIIATINILFMYIEDCSLLASVCLGTNVCILLISSIISLGIQGYFSEKLSRVEHMLLGRIKTEFYIFNSILNMLLPKFVKNRVKSGCRYISENKGEVTIIFCDLADFEKAYQMYEPWELTEFLDKYFSLLDQICEKTGVTKIETVGKTYMACAGLQDSIKEIPVNLRNESHAKLALKFASAVLEEVSEIELKDGDFVKIKIGINSGPVSAGVVGFHKPQFSLVGDTVNTASRMSSTLEDYNAIQISESTYDMVKHIQDYEFSHRIVEAKGKGKLNVYIVNESCQGLGETHNLGWMSKKYYKDDIIKSHSSEGLETSLSKSKHSGEGIESILMERRKSIEKIRFERKKSNESWTNEILETSKQEMISQKPRFNYDLSAIEEHEKIFREKNLQKHIPSVHLSLLVYLFSYLFMFLIDIINFKAVNIIKSIEPIIARLVSLALLSVITLFYKKLFSTKWLDLLIFTCILSMALMVWSNIHYKSDFFIDQIGLEILIIIFVITHVGQFPLLFTYILTLIILLGWIFVAWQESEFMRHFPKVLTVFFITAIYFKSRYNQELCERKNFNLQLIADKEIADNLALISNLMPKTALLALENEQTFTDSIDNATILFADIVGFTDWSSQKTPNQVIEMLSNLFTKFDKLCVTLGVYKVCTIGDCYVVMGYTGNQERKEAEECLNVIKMAFKMIEIINEENFIHCSNLNMRIGIHTGKVIEGVIGTSIIRFDIWGTDVLIANKMESNGKPGRVKVSEDTKKIMDKVSKEKFEYEESSDLSLDSLGIVKKTYFITNFEV